MQIKILSFFNFSSILIGLPTKKLNELEFKFMYDAMIKG